MISIRRGTFETNSSSTHSMVICTPEEYKEWSRGELLASRWENGFKTRKELINSIREKNPEYFDKQGNLNTDYYESIEDLLADECWYDIDGWVGDLECDETSYTTNGGEKLKIVCRYGYDG